jgi:hypothetical protein
MKTFILVLSLIAMPVMFSSCKKSSNTGPSSTSTYYIKLKINGTAKSMTLTPIVMFTNASPLYICQLSGYFTDNFGEGAIFTITDVAAITTGTTYTQQYLTGAGAGVQQTTFVYRGDDGKQYLAEGGISGTSVSVVFSEITSDHVKGTFSGTLLIQGTTTFVTITDGEFYLKRV